MDSTQAVAPEARLKRVIAESETLSLRLQIPVRLVSAHRELRAGKNQHALRWGAFLLAYASLEGFYTRILSEGSNTNRALPLNVDKIAQAAEKQDSVHLFRSDWGARTRTQIAGEGNRSRWHALIGTAALRTYLSDMKSLRDILSHGGDPYGSSNNSGMLWPVKGGFSMRLMGVEGFIQSCCDLAGQTIVAYGGTVADLPPWPEPTRSGLSSERLPPLPLLPK